MEKEEKPWKRMETPSFPMVFAMDVQAVQLVPKTNASVRGLP